MTREEQRYLKSLKKALEGNIRTNCKGHGYKNVNGYLYKQVGEYLYLLLVSVPPVDLGRYVSAKLWCKPLQLDEIYWDVFDMKETAAIQPFSFHVQGAFTADCLSLEEWKIPVISIDDIEQVLFKIFQTSNKYLEHYANTFKTMKDFKAAISEQPNQALNRILCEIYEENYPDAYAEIEECLSKNDTGGYLCGSKSIMDYAKEYCLQRL